MSSGASRHHSPVAACQRLHVGQGRSPQWSISTRGWLHCLQRLDGTRLLRYSAGLVVVLKRTNLVLHRRYRHFNIFPNTTWFWHPRCRHPSGIALAPVCPCLLQKLEQWRRAPESQQTLMRKFSWGFLPYLDAMFICRCSGPSSPLGNPPSLCSLRPALWPLPLTRQRWQWRAWHSRFWRMIDGGFSLLALWHGGTLLAVLLGQPRPWPRQRHLRSGVRTPQPRD